VQLTVNQVSVTVNVKPLPAFDFN